MDTVPFSPRFIEDSGMGRYYEDGRIIAAVDEGIVSGKRVLTISEWSSNFPSNGHTVTALNWFREHGFEIITANGVGLIEYGVGDIATAYWQHMHSKGLVDVLLDDEGNDITPGGPVESAESSCEM